MEQLSNYQSAHIDYIGSDALSTALAVYLGPLSPELRVEFIDQHWSKCLKERGIVLSWSSTEKVLIPSVTDEVGQSSGFNLDDDGESPDVAPATGKADNVDDVTNTGDDQKTDQDQKTDDQKTDDQKTDQDQKTGDQNGKSTCAVLIVRIYNCQTFIFLL